MLVAYNASEQLVLATDNHPDDAKYFCPACHEAVFLKGGQVKVKHFSHYRRCTESGFSEGESVAHLQGKLLLFNSFQQLGMRTALECYLPKLRQRPDLLVWNQYQQPFVIEYQCSAISEEIIAERSRGYWRNGYHVMWVMGEQWALGRSLSRFQQSCLRYDARIGFYAVVLDTPRKQLRVYYQVTQRRSGISFEQMTISVTDSRMRHLFTDTIPEMVTVTGRGQSTTDGQVPISLHQLNRLRMRQDVSHRTFISQLYTRQHDLYQLPSALFRLPHRHLATTVPLYMLRYEWLYFLSQCGGAFTRDALVSLFREFWQQHESWFVCFPLIDVRAVQRIVLRELMHFLVSAKLVVRDGQYYSCQGF